MLELFYLGLLISVTAEVTSSLFFPNYFRINAFGYFNYTVSDELKII